MVGGKLKPVGTITTGGMLGTCCGCWAAPRPVIMAMAGCKAGKGREEEEGGPAKD